MAQSPLTQEDLVNPPWSETHYIHKLTGLKYTEGVRNVAVKGGAYWLLDKIAILTWFGQHDLHPNSSDFACWKLKVGAGSNNSLRCEDGNGNRLYEERIEFTDFPLPEIAIWREGDVFLLPSEH